MREQRAQGTPSTVLVIVLSAIGMLFAGMLLGSARGETPPPPTQVAALVVSESAPSTPEPALNGEQGQAAADLGVLTPAPAQEVAFEVGNELTIAALRTRYISGSEITLEQQLQNGANYYQYIASYISEGNRIYGLLTIPMSEMPPGGFKAIVFNHGYIPPSTYRTTERYVAYVDTLARNGFVVFKIDLRGHGNSEGVATGSYYSPDYTIDAIAALKSLQTLPYVDPDGIGMWGHSMAGNLVLRAMLIEPDIKAAVIWAGAGYSYDDLANYGISDTSFRREPDRDDDTEDLNNPRRRGRLIRETYGPPDTSHPFWRAVSLTANLRYLQAPLQLHHAVDDTVVSVAYSRDLVAALQENGKVYEYYEYAGGGHNIESPYFDEAILRTVAFFQTHL